MVRAVVQVFSGSRLVSVDLGDRLATLEMEEPWMNTVTTS